MKAGQAVRQGDVLVVKRKAQLPNKLKKADRDAGRVVLAYGEVTGHAHAIVDAQIDQLLDEVGNQHLKAVKAGTLKHEQHGPHAIPAGDFDVVRQFEYDEVEEGLVSD